VSVCVCQEEELRKEGGKYAHLNEELHVSIEAFAHPVDCYGRLSHALYELRRHLVPVRTVVLSSALAEFIFQLETRLTL